MSNANPTNPFRQLPSVNDLVSRVQAQWPTYRHERLVEVCRAVLNAARMTIQAGQATPTQMALLTDIHNLLTAREVPALRMVINATGIILHTNLGRAPLSEAACQAMQVVALGYSTLEYALDSGQRGHRNAHVESLLCEVTGAEAALVVNNNAAAVYLVLNALAQDKEVLISRGELVEIGGGFRIPDVMRQAGVHLIEVGTTNRTHLKDYEQAITERTMALLRVHSSNFRLIGFTESPPLSDLAQLAHQHERWLFDDLGSGALLDTRRFGLDLEPTVGESLAVGADVVMFSGDKLLGGPQAGIIVGRKALIDRLRDHPLTRALRPDKLCLAALSATLRHYRDEDPLQTIPVWRMISLPEAEIHQRASHWQQTLGGEVEKSFSAVGGGSLPGNTLPTFVLALTTPHPNQFVSALRQQMPPVIARIEADRVLLDPRTVLPEQDVDLIRVVQTVQDF